jgi:phage tail sheath protein FI
MDGDIEEIRDRPGPIEGVATGTAGFAGPEGPEAPTAVTGAAELSALLGESAAPLARMAAGFFANGGRRAYVAQAIDDLAAVDEVSLLCPLPGDTTAAIAQCERRRDRIAIVSLPAGLDDARAVLAGRPAEPSAFAALHHPWVRAGGALTPPGGHVAGLYARSDLEHGVGHAPTDLALRGLDAEPLERLLGEAEIEQLGAGAVNVLRLAGGHVRLWGARTFTSDDEWKYVTVRRLLIFLEESLDRGLQWAVFEPNGEPLWAAVRRAVEAFLTVLWRAGDLLGSRPGEAFFVRCDRTTMTQDDLDAGRLVCVIGVAPVKPAEFVIIRIGQWTADRRCP